MMEKDIREIFIIPICDIDVDALVSEHVPPPEVKRKQLRIQIVERKANKLTITRQTGD